MAFPGEIYDAIACQLADGKDVGVAGRQPDGYRRYKIHSIDSRRALANMRLASRELCESATPCLFRHIVAREGVPWQGPGDSEPPLTRLQQISDSPLAKYVRQVDVGLGGFTPWHHAWRQAFFDNQNQLPVELGIAFNADIDGRVAYARALDGLLARCLASFPNLVALDFIGEPLAAEYKSTKPASRDTTGNMLAVVRSRVRCRPWIRPYVAMARTFFQTVRDPRLQRLTELSLVAPNMRHLEPWFSIQDGRALDPIPSLLGRLRYLALDVIGRTNYEPPYNPERHTKLLLDLIKLACHIDSLILVTRSWVDLTDLDLDPSLRLKYLHLAKVSVPSSKLVDVIGQSTETLESVRLRDVTIPVSGSWRDVFLEIGKCPRLSQFEYLDEELTPYYPTNNGAGLPQRHDSPRAAAEPCRLLDPDKFALGSLQRQVNANRAAAGLSQIPSSVYEYAEGFVIDEAAADRAAAGISQVSRSVYRHARGFVIDVDDALARIESLGLDNGSVA